MVNYKERLYIPIEGDDKTVFSTFSNLDIAKGYKRIVLGGRGPYVEFREELFRDRIVVPYTERWRSNNDKAFYIEYRTTDESSVKIYFQKKKVAYADYKIGFFYISPFSLLVDKKVIIKTLRQLKKEQIK